MGYVPYVSPVKMHRCQDVTESLFEPVTSVSLPVTVPVAILKFFLRQEGNNSMNVSLNRCRKII